MEAFSRCSTHLYVSQSGIYDVVSFYSPRRKSLLHFPNQRSQFHLTTSSLLTKQPLTHRTPLHCRAATSAPSASSSHSFDVVIIGAGIIGLTIARQLLLETDLSVAVVDKAVPCSGATGAGQGYIWMTHKAPGSHIWELALRSHKLWEMLAERVRDDGMDPSQVLGWMRTGMS